MTTTRTHPSSPPHHQEDGGALLVAEIEHYLATHTPTTRPATAHPLVTRTTQQLIDQALHAAGPAPAPPALTGPRRLLRYLPTSVLRRLPHRTRPVSVAEHLELTALVIQRHGWAHGTLRTPSGRRCIAGAQTLLHQLGYGTRHTLHHAGRHLDTLLTQRGQTGPYWHWNDHPDRTRHDVLNLLHTAATTAERTRA